MWALVISEVIWGTPRLSYKSPFAGNGIAVLSLPLSGRGSSVCAHFARPLIFRVLGRLADGEGKMRTRLFAQQPLSCFFTTPQGICGNAKWKNMNAVGE